MLKIKAIYANTESLDVRNSIFEKTHALLEGGAMVIDTAWMAKSNHHIENSNFTMATSKKGGAIYYGISGGTDIGKKSVSPASGLLRGLRFESCVATEAAGAVYCDDVEVHVDNSNLCLNCYDTSKEAYLHGCSHRRHYRQFLDHLSASRAIIVRWAADIYFDGRFWGVSIHADRGSNSFAIVSAQ